MMQGPGIRKRLSPETTPAPPEHGRRRMGLRRKRIRNTALAMLGVVLAVAVAAGGFLWYLGTAYDEGRSTIAGALPVDKPPRTEAAENARNILLMGSETRNPASGDATPDMMMLLHLPGDRSGVYVLSILPYAVVDVPGHGSQPIDSTMRLGGVSLTVETVQNLFNVPIDHVAVVDFEGFRGLTNALGGVTLHNDAPFHSDGPEGEFFAAGRITVQGESALNYVRTRHTFTGDSDSRRMRNEQALLAGILSGLLDRGQVPSPVMIGNVVNEISPYLSVDEEFDSRTAGALAFSLREIRPADIHMYTLPVQGGGVSAAGLPAAVPDAAAVADITAALAADNLAGYLPAGAPAG
ncbi:LCP family protein [Arthrobacter sp. zg-Y411]|uniref:LCP family protein n=1 Tax=Arthrobacter zhangbolii TaxID=2886936 RepID=UPI001D13EE5D|nr:LCP family protein [Arthrobacter zhangbolii]MCC3293022.1 LCP family protein [Arthrobacter zhangbolii]